MRDERSYDLLDEALDRLLPPPGDVRGPRREQFPDQAELRRMLAVASASRAALETPLSPEVKARHTKLLMDAAREAAGATTTITPAKRRAGAFRRMVLRPIAVMAVMLLVALPATAALASESLPDSSLYGVKLAVENLTLFLETDLDDEVGLHLGFADRRIGELEEMSALGKFKGVPRALGNLEGHLDSASSDIETLEGEGASTESLIEHLLEVTSKHLDVLGGLAEDAGCDAGDPEAGAPQCKGLLNAMENSSKHLDRIRSDRGKPEGTPGGKPETTGRPEGTPQRPESTRSPESPGKLEDLPTGSGGANPPANRP